MICLFHLKRNIGYLGYDKTEPPWMKEFYFISIKLTKNLDRGKPRREFSVNLCQEREICGTKEHNKRLILALFVTVDVLKTL